MEVGMTVPRSYDLAMSPPLLFLRFFTSFMQHPDLTQVLRVSSGPKGQETEVLAVQTIPTRKLSFALSSKLIASKVASNTF